MAGSPVLDTILGLTFVFLLASLMCTGALEALSSFLNMRGKFLLKGLREMLDVPPAAIGRSADVAPPMSTLLSGPVTRGELQQLTDAGGAAGTAQTAPTQPVSLADLVLAHPLIVGMHRPRKPGEPGRTVAGTEKVKLASYVPARAFAAGMIDLLVPHTNGTATLSDITASISGMSDNSPAKPALSAIVRAADGQIDGFRERLESWYDDQMARVSGWYQRWAKWRLLIAGGILAVLLNVDPLNIAQTLYHDQPVRDAVVAQAVSAETCTDEPGTQRTRCLADRRATLEGLPVPLGWHVVDTPADWVTDHLSPVTGGIGGVLLKILGWLLTACAVSLGAPFWFDALGRLGSFRTAGQKPT